MLGVVITDATQGLEITLFGIKATESNSLIASQVVGRVDRTAHDHVKLKIGLAQITKIAPACVKLPIRAKSR